MAPTFGVLKMPLCMVCYHPFFIHHWTYYTQDVAAITPALQHQYQLTQKTY